MIFCGLTEVHEFCLFLNKTKIRMTYDGMIKRTSITGNAPFGSYCLQRRHNQKLANDIIVNCSRNRLMLIEY